MTRRVTTVTPDTPVVAAARLMLERKIGGLPVVDTAGRVVGFLSEHDLLRRRRDSDCAGGSHWLELMIKPVGFAEESAEFHGRKVREVMTPNPVTVTAASPLKDTCRLIEERGIKRLPVVQDGELVGIIARADLVRALAQSIERAVAAPTRDVSVDRRLAELERQIWRNRARSAKPF